MQTMSKIIDSLYMHIAGHTLDHYIYGLMYGT